MNYNKQKKELIDRINRHTLTTELFSGDVGELLFTGFGERGAQKVICVEQSCSHMVKRHLHPSMKTANKLNKYSQVYS